MNTRKVAIACQGGGTHAAFTWGVLTEILRTKQRWDSDAETGTRFDIVALSGTSAGALCALAAWYGLTPNLTDPDCGTIDKAIERLEFLWTTFAATTPIEHAHNHLIQDFLRLRESGIPSPEMSPYDRSSQAALAGLQMLGARSSYLGFADLLTALCPSFAHVDWEQSARTPLRLLVAAIEVISGNFELFDSDRNLFELGLPALADQGTEHDSMRWRMRRALSLEGVAASGTLPEVLPAQVIEDLVFPTCQPGQTVRRNGYYWDGLYSQNPPVRDLLGLRRKSQKPDEVWVIRINPQEFYPDSPRPELSTIRDRVNDLAGNLALNQELDHILMMNRWVGEYGGIEGPLKEYKQVDLRTIKMSWDCVQKLGLASKFDRNPIHIAQLREEGQSVARQWLHGWQAMGAGFATYPNDARYPESACEVVIKLADGDQQCSN